MKASALTEKGGARRRLLSLRKSIVLIPSGKGDQASSRILVVGWCPSTLFSAFGPRTRAGAMSRSDRDGAAAHALAAMSAEKAPAPPASFASGGGGGGAALDFADAAAAMAAPPAFAPTHAHAHAHAGCDG